MGGILDLFGNMGEFDTPDTPKKKYSVEDLKRLYELYNEKHTFKAGDLVTWKCDEMQNIKWPERGCFGIVMEVLDLPAPNGTGGIGTDHYLTEYNDLKVGVFANDTFVMYFMSSARLAPYILETPKIHIDDKGIITVNE